MFSVLMSCYKNDSSEFLHAALLSILQQSVRPAELVLVKDGHLNPDLDYVIEEFEARFSDTAVNFILLPLPANEGLGKALQAGLLVCTEEYIVRMDADDISRSARLQRLSDIITRNPEVDIFGSQIEEFFESPNDLGRFRNVPLEHDDIVRHGVWRNPMNHVTVCFKRSVVLEAGGYEPMLWFEDWFLWLKLIRKNIKFKNVYEVHVDVRVSSFAERRTGVGYLAVEFRFCKAAVLRNYWTLLSGIKFLVPRIFLRLLPAKLLMLVYSKILRTK
jgi:glycosyltransferase involved in cell wall biosynthesis